MIIESNHIKFSQISDPIKTEEVINNYLIKEDINFDYVSLPIAYSINNLGIDVTQRLVNEINERYPQKKVFVCQHILVNRIQFGDNYIFTPHTLESDDFLFIPHYNPIYAKRREFKKISEREFDFSFIGDYSTNKLRKDISEIKLDRCLYEPTGKWFFSYDSNTQNVLKQRYIETIENTKLPLCPPGTGPSTLRLFEALSSGGIPIIFNDLKLPEDLKKLVIRIDIQSLNNGDIYKLLGRNLEEIQEEILETYWNNYSNELLHLPILKKFEKN